MGSFRCLYLVLAFSRQLTAQALPSPPDHYAMIQIANGSAAGINNLGQVAGNSNHFAFLWTPLMPNGSVGNVVDLGVSPYRSAAT